MQVLAVDEALIIVCKPTGLLSVPGRLPENKDCLITRLQAEFADALTVHRLDQVTSGLMVFARSKAAQAHLSAQFAQRLVHKRYTAWVEGHVLEGSGSIDLPLICDWPNRPRQKVDFVDGKPALTHWRVLERSQADAAPRTLLELTPVTGRSHQLRLHLASIGHPIVGDDFYGAQPAARVCLHASELGLSHPSTGVAMQWQSAAPF